jgi:hypothetical protein
LRQKFQMTHIFVIRAAGMALPLTFESGIAIASLSSKPMNIPAGGERYEEEPAWNRRFADLAQLGFSQTSTYSSSTSRTTEANPHAVTNNTLATHGGTGFNNPSQWGRANAEYVQHEIARAKSEGKDG